MELVVPAGSRGALQSAIEAGADVVYLGLRDETNARHFPGLNFSTVELPATVERAHLKGCKVYLAINTYSRAGEWKRWQSAVDAAAESRVDALIAADMAVLEYASRTYPDLRLHLSVQASATNWRALRFYRNHFGIERAVLPRVLSLTQVERLAERNVVPLEVFGFGGLCIMAEGRCLFSSYACGRSPNNYGACSPAEAVEWRQDGEVMETRVGGVLVDRFGEADAAGYPTLCKGRYQVRGKRVHAFEEPVSLNSLELLPRLAKIGIHAIKLEGRQRSPAYVFRMTRIWRAAIDSVQANPDGFSVLEPWKNGLADLAEGQQTVLGAYARVWQ
ncbi:MAG TPA: peptidase U32 family protein [Gammaproteobacteria bacterium]|nr:peptidase U32 family protein [Gammaproteobacteria bacterium]